jgi:hypothetical protein
VIAEYSREDRMQRGEPRNRDGPIRAAVERRERNSIRPQLRSSGLMALPPLRSAEIH